MAPGRTRRPVTPSQTRLSLPVALAATTGKLQAIASSVTLPNVSVTEGLNRISIDATARPRSGPIRSEEHTSELQSLMSISYAVFCLKKKKQDINIDNTKQ